MKKLLPIIVLFLTFSTVIAKTNHSSLNINYEELIDRITHHKTNVLLDFSPKKLKESKNDDKTITISTSLSKDTDKNKNVVLVTEIKNNQVTAYICMMTTNSTTQTSSMHLLLTIQNMIMASSDKITQKQANKILSEIKGALSDPSGKSYTTTYKEKEYMLLLSPLGLWLTVSAN